MTAHRGNGRYAAKGDSAVSKKPHPWRQWNPGQFARNDNRTQMPSASARLIGVPHGRRPSKGE